MRRIVLFLLILSLISPLAKGSTVLANDMMQVKTASDDTAELLVSFEEGEAEVIEAIEASGAEVVENVSSVALLVEVDESELDDLEEELESLDFLVRVGENERVSAFLSSSVPHIQADKPRTQTTNSRLFRGEGVGVCVIDSGVYYSHPDLGNCTEAEFLAGDCVKVPGGYDYVNSDANPWDDNGHGTHVAGIVGANGSILGVAPDAKIIAMKALNNDGSGTTGTVHSSIQWCINNRNSYDISIITMSLGSVNVYTSACDGDSTWSSIKTLVDIATDAGMTVLAATGNDNSYTGISAPACLSNVIAVTNSELDDTIYTAGSGGNRNGITDIAAPGVTINSTTPPSSECTGTPGDKLCSDAYYAKYTGTSMSAPHAAGVAALLVEAGSEMNGQVPNRSAILSALQDTGISIDDTAQSGLTFKRVDAWASIQSLDLTAPDNPTDTFTTRDLDSVSIMINWSRMDETANYTVYRGNTSSVTPTSYDRNWSLSNVTSYNDTNVSLGEGYFYIVTATDVGGNENISSYVVASGYLETDAPSVNVSLHTEDDGSVTQTVLESAVFVNASAEDYNSISSLRYRIVNASNSSGVLVNWTDAVSQGQWYKGFNLSGMLIPTGNWTLEANATDNAGNSNTSSWNFTSSPRLKITEISVPVTTSLSGQFPANYTVEAKGYSSILVSATLALANDSAADGVVGTSDKGVFSLVSGSAGQIQASSVTDFSNAEVNTISARSVVSPFNSDMYPTVFYGNISVYFDMSRGYAGGDYSGTIRFGLSDS